MARRTLAPAALLVFLWGPGGSPAIPAGEPGPAPFALRVTSPDPLYLAGSCRLTVVAETRSGEPYEGIAWMTLSIDGGSPRPDTSAPFAWDLELGPGSARHRLTVQAVDRTGERVTLSAVSGERAGVERVGVELVLVPVLVRALGPDGAPGRLVDDLTEEDFTVIEDGAPRPLARFSREAVALSVVVALDTSASMERSLWSAQKAVNGFVRAQNAGSELSLLAFNDDVYLEHEFTIDREALAASVAALRVDGTRTALVDALRVGSAHLARRDGPRVLVLFTDGQETVYDAPDGRLRTAIDAAQAADVTVFAVAFGNALLPPLQEMTSATGGEVIVARGAREMQKAFERIAESLGGRYLLSYEPPEPERGGYRRLQVKVSRPGVQVLAREGYHAGGGTR